VFYTQIVNLTWGRIQIQSLKRCRYCSLGRWIKKSRRRCFILTWYISWFRSVLEEKCRDNTSVKDRLFPSKFFQAHQSSSILHYTHTVKHTITDSESRTRNSGRTNRMLYFDMTQNKTNSLAWARDWMTAACRRSYCQLLLIEGATWSAWRFPTAVISVSRPESLLFLSSSPSIVLTRLSGPITPQKIL
jgi:hypothetical protein